jgi:hypothetical protein
MCKRKEQVNKTSIKNPAILNANRMYSRVDFSGKL